MLNLLKALRQDEYGVILSAEIVVVGSLLVIGLITGLTCLQQSVNGELKDLAGAVGSLDQSYSFSAHRKQGHGHQCCAWTAGSSFANCEHKADRCTDIVGCTEPCGHSTQGAHGCCESSASPVVDVGVSCATCGGLAGGCGVCGGGVSASGVLSVDGYQAPRKARCIESGVPKMKVSEWPLDCQEPVGVPSSEPPIDGPRGQCAPPVLTIPHEHMIHEHSENAEPHGQHHDARRLNHAAPPVPIYPHSPAPRAQPAPPMPHPPTQPIPSNDPLPMPASERPDLPASTT